MDTQLSPADKLTAVAKAKDAVRYLLDHPTGSVDWHGLAYWAGVVERLRRELREEI